ncbi:MAG: hypothetical protein ACREMX_14865 [Gemmatimonadales bacterium]
MNDDRVVRLLEELRDLQRQHAQNYQEALRNQAESIQLQRSAVGRMRALMVAVSIALVLAVVAVLALVLSVASKLY